MAPDRNHHTGNTFMEAINNDIENLLTRKAAIPKSKPSIQEKKP